MLLSSCSDEISVPNNVSNVKEGDDVTLSFSVSIPDPGMARTRTFDDQHAGTKVLNLWLFVFDNEGFFVQARQATNLRRQGEDTNLTLFDVTLTKTASQRHIHFIAFDGNESDGVGALISGMSHTFGTEQSKLEKLITIAGQAAYWQRLTVNGIDEDTKFTRVPLVRNYAKVSVTSQADNFTYQGFFVVNVPDKGTVAPFANGDFVTYTSGETNLAYNALTTAGYHGISASGVQYTQKPADLQNAVSNNNESQYLITAGNSAYLYETPNSTGDAKGRTFLIIKGNNKYYKVDFVYWDSNNSENVFYNILRNFHYQVTIKEVKGDGFNSITAAANSTAGNNLSASTTTTNLNQISDGDQTLLVTNTYFCFTEGGITESFKFKYTYGSSNTNGNRYINLAVTGNAINGTPTVTGPDSDGWSTVTMTLASLGSETKTSNIRLYAKDVPNITGELLSRTVQVDLRSLFDLRVVCPEFVAGSQGTAFVVNLLIPVGINDALFPLDFAIESVAQSIYPDATNDDGQRLPVSINPTIVDDSGTPSFQYVRTVTQAEYASLGTTSVNGTTYKVVPCYFKTNVDASATTVYAVNTDYFSTTNNFDDFTNIPIAITEGSTLTVQGTEWYGKEIICPITFSVTQDFIDAHGTITLTITEGSESPVNVNLVGGTDITAAGDYTYNGYKTKTFGNSDLSVTLSTNTFTDRPTETLSGETTLNRKYFLIAKNSFTVSGLLQNNGSMIYMYKGSSPNYEYAYYGGWFGGDYNPADFPGPYYNVSTCALSPNGLTEHYTIFANSVRNSLTGGYQALDLEEDTKVKIMYYQSSDQSYATIDYNQPYIITTIQALDEARIYWEQHHTETGYTPQLQLTMGQ